MGRMSRHMLIMAAGLFGLLVFFSLRQRHGVPKSGLALGGGVAGFVVVFRLAGSIPRKEANPGRWRAQTAAVYLGALASLALVLSGLMGITEDVAQTFAERRARREAQEERAVPKPVPPKGEESPAPPGEGEGGKEPAPGPRGVTIERKD